MATDLATSNDGGISNTAVGSFTGTGVDVDVAVGFKPRMIRLINLTDRTVYEIFSDMAVGHALKSVAAGTMTDDAAGILIRGSQDAYRGFFIPAAIAINTKAFYYVAFG
jgi:hypothetical protein